MNIFQPDQEIVMSVALNSEVKILWYNVTVLYDQYCCWCKSIYSAVSSLLSALWLDNTLDKCSLPLFQRWTADPKVFNKCLVFLFSPCSSMEESALLKERLQAITVIPTTLYQPKHGLKHVCMYSRSAFSRLLILIGCLWCNRKNIASRKTSGRGNWSWTVKKSNFSI